MAAGTPLRQILGVSWVMCGRMGLALVELIGRRVWIIEYTVVDYRERIANAARALRGV